MLFRFTVAQIIDIDVEHGFFEHDQKFDFACENETGTGKWRIE